MRRTILAVLFATSCAFLAVGTPPAQAEAEKPSLGLRYPSLSPDGTWVAFDYRGDIWRAPVDGSGHADRLTIHEAQDTLPRVSPDGTQIAFTSRRNGGFDLFVIPSGGGVPSQVTFHSGVELLCDWSPDGARLLFLSNREPSLWQMDLYEVAVAGGTPRRITRDGGREGCYALDGKQIVYVRGFNTIYQDNYSGSANYDVHLIDAAGGTPRRLMDSPGNERWPFLSADGKTLYFVAEDQRVANLYKMPVGGGAREQVTRGTNLDVHRLSPSWDRRKAVFERGGRLAWVDLEEAGAPFHEIPLTVRSDERSSGVEVRTITGGGEQVDVSRDGSQLAFTRLGDLWILPGAGGPGRRLTATPEEEQWPRFSPDGRRLAFSAKRGGASDVFVMDLATKAVTQVTKHAADDFFQAWSPDGTRLVFSSERSGNRDIWSIELASGKETQLTDHPTADDDPVYSPDGRWIAFDSARDGGQAIFVMPAEGGAARRVSQGAGFFQVPSWSPDGSMLAFEAFRPDSGESGGLFVVAFGGGAAMQLSRDGQVACWTRTGDWIYFHATRGGEAGVWRMQAPRAVTSGERVPFLGRIEVDRRAELAGLFDEAWEHLRTGFYDPRMHGVDWNAMKAKYRDMAVDAENKDSFYNVINQMLAELGASHLGISPGDPDEDEPAPRRGPATGTLGLELDAGEGPRPIRSLFPGGPAEKAGLKVGESVVTLKGEALTASTDLDRLLAGTAGQEVKLSVRAAGADATAAARDVTLKALAPAALAKLHFDGWRERSEKRVKEGGGGAIAYLHLDQMNPENLTRFQQAIARFNQNKKLQGLVLDVRENGGGNIHEQLMAVLQARPFVRMQPRGMPRITQPQLYWDKPIVLLVNERSFSDAEVFPWSFKTAGIGKTVGMPTPGGVIGTNDIKLSDGSTFRVPRVGWYSLDGKNLELNGFVPDILVPETSEDRLQGRDPQLDKALEVVLAEVKARVGAAPGPSEPEPTPAPTDEPQQPAASLPAEGEPLADVKPGEWVRYRVSLAGAPPATLRYSVLAVEGDKVTFQREVESGGGWLPPLPEQLTRGPLADLLPLLGAVRSTARVQAQVGGAAADGLLVTVEIEGREATCLFTNAVPALGLLKVELGRQVVVQALEWGSTPPASGAAAPTPEAAPTPTPTAPTPAAPPAPEKPAPPVPAAPPPPAPEGAEAADGEAPTLEIDNPLADAAVGEWLRFRQVVRGVASIVTLEVLEVTATEVVIRSVVQEGESRLEGPPLRRPRAARIAAARGRAQVLRHGTEDLSVAGASVPCTVVTVAGRRGGPDTTTWTSLAVPVTGVVKRMRGEEVVLEALAWGTQPPAAGS